MTNSVASARSGTRTPTPHQQQSPQQPGQQPAFGTVASRPAGHGGPDSGHDYAAIAASAEFVRLRRTHRRFVFPLCLLFFAWYMVYVLLAAYAHDFMSQRLFGLVNVGLVLGVLQFVSTGLITVLYVRFARRRLDPQVDAIRATEEAGPA